MDFENGHKRFGVIPKQNENSIKGHINTGYVEGYNITSNSKYR